MLPAAEAGKEVPTLDRDLVPLALDAPAGRRAHRVAVVGEIFDGADRARLAEVVVRSAQVRPQHDPRALGRVIRSSSKWNCRCIFGIVTRTGTGTSAWRHEGRALDPVSPRSLRLRQPS